MLHKLLIMSGNIIKNNSILYTVHKKKNDRVKGKFHTMGQCQHEAN